VFFFEKKNQKTFTHVAYASGDSATAHQKFFASFFQKRRPSFLMLRDRFVSDPRFRAWAARFFLTRFVARRRTRELFDICAGFVYAQVLAACVSLRLFDVLAEGPQSVARLSARCSLPMEGMARLLDAAVALKLVSRRSGGAFGLGGLGAAMVGNEAVASMVAHHSMLYADLADPVALLRGERETRLSAYWAYARAESPASVSGDEVAPYTALMAASQTLVAGEILDAYPVGRHRCLLDVGGGDGSFLRAAAARAPGLQLILFDLPAVAAKAEARFAASGLSERARAIGGSFRNGPLPQGADIISLVRVVHDHDDEVVVGLLRAAHAALPQGGTLLLAEPMAATPAAERMGDAYFGFYLLAMGSGRPRTAATLKALLTDAGFTQVRRVRTHTPLLASVLVARRG
jgi:demethylspheroidene O-methyltransferase